MAVSNRRVAGFSLVLASVLAASGCTSRTQDAAPAKAARKEPEGNRATQKTAGENSHASSDEKKQRSETPRVDVSSEEAFTKSLERIAESLSKEEREQFKEDLAAVIFAEALSAGLQGIDKDKPLPKGLEAFKSLHGMSAEEIRAKAQKALAESGGKGRTGPATANEAKPNSQKKVADLSWHPHEKPIRIGDVEVQITEAMIGKILLEEFGFGGRRTDHSDKNLTMIKVKPINRSDTKKTEHQSWMEGGLGLNSPSLRDEFNNTYNRLVFGFGTRPVGAPKSFQSIYPGETATDIIVFERPVEKATQLHLELPAKNFDADGIVRIRIPVSSIKRGAD